MGGEDGFNPPKDSNRSNEDMIEAESNHYSEPSVVNKFDGGTGIQDFDSNLPKTVTLLQGPNGSKLYLIGTAHFSVESQEDVSNVIRAVKPHIVVVELCRARSSMLRMDEKTIEREATSMTYTKMKEIIKDNGFLQGMMSIIMLNVSAQISRDLGMAPGGEFRRAFHEVKQIPGCLLHFGDRPIHITLKRALSVLSWWQRFWLACSLLFENKKFTKDDVEQFKESDLLASVLKKMSTEFPEIGEVFIRERDIYLTFSLQTAVKSSFCNKDNQLEPTIAVGVVGLGHTPGITQMWMSVTEEDVQPVLVVEEKKKSSGVWKRSLAIGVIIFIGFKMRNRIKIHTTYNHFLAWIK